MGEAGYYLRQAPKLLRRHAKIMSVGRAMLEARFGDKFASEVVLASESEYERLLPELPYIGGKENSFTDTVLEIASLLALGRVLKRRGASIEEIGDLIEKMAQAWINRYPRVLRRLIGRLYMSRFWRNRTRKRALHSQERSHSGDFVYEVVDGDGDFEWGINYLECAVVKLFERLGESELMPAMCKVDYLLFPSIGIDLKRSGTIAQGCSHCDFRFYSTQVV